MILKHNFQTKDLIRDSCVMKQLICDRLLVNINNIIYKKMLSLKKFKKL